MMNTHLIDTDMSNFVRPQNISINKGFIQLWINNFLFGENLEIIISEVLDYLEKDDKAFTIFSVIGLKNWKFGEIIYQKEDGSWEISLFGEHVDYIDKFKPTATKISRSFTISNKDFENGEPFIYELYKFVEDIKHIKRQPWAMKYFYYGDLEDNKLKWLIKQLWFYRIELPIRKFLESRGNYFIAKSLKLYIKAFYKKAIEDADIVKMYDFAFPNVVLQIKIKDEYIETIGYKIWKKFNYFRGFGHCLNIDICEYFEKKGKYGWYPVYWKKND